MKSKIILIISFFLLFNACKEKELLTSYVNPFIGTDAHGHTYPGAALPFGFMQLSPDTRLDGWDGCSAYHFSDSLVYGFSHTHLSGTGVSDYADILFMPTIGKPLLYRGSAKEYEKGYASFFQKKNETAQAGFNTIPDNEYNTVMNDFWLEIKPQNLRYIKVKAINYGSIPDWHLGKGGEAFIFIDEIMINE